MESSRRPWKYGDRFRFGLRCALYAYAQAGLRQCPSQAPPSDRNSHLHESLPHVDTTEVSLQRESRGARSHRPKMLKESMSGIVQALEAPTA
jgi:hypothetical protein